MPGVVLPIHMRRCRVCRLRLLDWVLPATQSAAAAAASAAATGPSIPAPATSHQGLPPPVSAAASTAVVAAVEEAATSSASAALAAASSATSVAPASAIASTRTPATVATGRHKSRLWCVRSAVSWRRDRALVAGVSAS